MSDFKSIITRALQSAGIAEHICEIRTLSGGCIHAVRAAVCDSGRTYVAKIAPIAQCGLFDEEAAGLRAIAATQTVKTPCVLGVVSIEDHAVLLQRYVERGTASTASWNRFGENLAAMHSADSGSRFGFDIDNHCGPSPQPNEWSSDWVEFNREHRIGHQLDLARSNYRIDRSQAKRVAALNDRLDEFMPRNPHPALLHGDLWSGNALPSVDGEIFVIDPATYIGDGWADIAMMQLFGGFPNAFLNAYRDAVDDDDNVDQRIAAYQLYHLLNHVNIFGGGYAEQAMSIVRRLGF